MPESARELTSWKEIAAALGGVNVRTAQKWERERGLPVRRLPGGRGRVAVDTLALEAWKRNTPHEPADDTTYRWPLDKELLVEVRFTGTAINTAHIDLLRQYLDLVKTALENPHHPLVTRE